MCESLPLRWFSKHLCYKHLLTLKSKGKKESKQVVFKEHCALWADTGNLNLKEFIYSSNFSCEVNHITKYPKMTAFPKYFDIPFS